MIKQLILFILIFTSVISFAQIGGTKTYRFLDIPMPARSVALGGATAAIWDDDVNLAYANPALLQQSASKQLAFNYVNYIADLNYGNFAYAQQLKKFATFGAGLQYFNYGKFDGRDEYDKETGNFKAADYSLNLSLAKPLNADSTLSIGTTIKTIYSHYDIYKSFGNALDVGLTYHNKNKLTISLVAQNYGRIWKPYSNSTVKEELPSNVSLSLSKKVSKAPFRLILQYDQLLKWDLTYKNPADENKDIDPFTNLPIVKSKRELRREKLLAKTEKLGKHLTIGTEIILTKNFNIRLAYNFRKGQEMSLPDKKTANGLSAGFGLKIYKFHLNYAFSKYALTGNVHTIGITTNFNYFSKK